MPQPRRRAGFAQKAKLCRLITEISLADDFQCHQASQIDVERFVSDAHCTAPQLDRGTVFARHKRIVLKSLRHLFRCRLDHFLRLRRFARFKPASKTLAKHAYRAGLVDPRERRTTHRTGLRLIDVLGHGRPSRLALAKLASVPQPTNYASVSN